MFGKLKTVDWVLKISLSENTESEIRRLDLALAILLSNFTILTTYRNLTFWLASFKKRNINRNILEEKFHELILLAVSSLADKLNDFSSFLTVSRKLGYICLFIFHIISRPNWFGKWYFPRQKFLIFFLRWFSPVTFWNCWETIVIGTQLVIFWSEIFG